MKSLCIPFATLMILTLAPTAAHAQSPKLGLALNLTIPTGEFNNTHGTGLANGQEFRYTSGYDAGLGAQFSLSFPVDQRLAFRFVFGGQTHRGQDRAPGYDTINLRHSMLSLGGDVQIFTDSAFRHRGTYFIGGLSADFEKFERSFFDLDDEWTYPEDIDSERKTRLGANFGIGHSFGYNSGIRFTLEATYHKTLTGNNTHNGEPISCDFTRLSFGVVF